MNRCIITGMIIFITLALSVAAGAGELKTKVYRQLKLTKIEYKGKCAKHSVFKGVRNEELFYVMDCPVCYPGKLQIQEDNNSGSASKGRMVYEFKCVMESTDFYGGNPKKTRKKEAVGCVTAEYIDVFDELSFVNLRVTGPKVCAWPILDKMNALMEKQLEKK